MRAVWTRRARRSVGIAALVQLACASAPPPDAREDEPRFRAPHGCKGATLTIYTDRMSPAEALPEPELGPEPPPPDLPPEMNERRWAEGSGARAAAPVIEREIAETKCAARYKWNQNRWAVECQEPQDYCGWSTKDADALAERIRRLVTPAVNVNVNSCVCRTYNRGP